MEVTTSPTMMGATGDTVDNMCHLELDGKSTSLISQMIIYQDSKEIERIDEYDQLGYILADTQMPQFVEHYKQYEGGAFQNYYGNEGDCLNVKPTSSALVSNPISALTDVKNFIGNRLGVNPTTVIPMNIGNAVIAQQTSSTLLSSEFAKSCPSQVRRSIGAVARPTFMAFDINDTEFGVDGYSNYIGAITQNPGGLSDPGDFGYIRPFSRDLSNNKSQYLAPNVKTLKIVNG